MRRLGWILLFTLACTSFAQKTDSPIWEPPSVIEFPDYSKSTVRHEIITGLRVSGMGIVLEESALEAVKSRAGGTIGHRGDAGDSLSWLCFHGTNTEDPWVLWLMSGEMDGGSVGGFRWQRLDQTTAIDTRCQPLYQGKQGIELPITLRLGTKEAAVLNMLGQPTNRLGDLLLYLHEHEEKVRNEPYTAMNTVAVVLRGGAVWALEVWKSTTN
jgi:hypothetical protein